ncbi:hypothetical protein ACOMHN_042119 [Nucella lapillus]
MDHVPVTGPLNTGPSSVPGADLSADSMAGTVVGGALAAVMVVMLVILTLCLRSCWKTSQPRRREAGHHEVPVDEELGVSAQIADIEQFRITPTTPHNNSSASQTSSIDTSFFRGSNRTFEGIPDSDSYGLHDVTCSSEDCNSSWNNSQSDASKLEESSCRTWLLESVDRMEVIEEESEVPPVSFHTGSPCSSASVSSNANSNASPSDDVLSFQSCSEGSSESVPDTVISCSTSTDYKTCSERTNVLNRAFSESTHADTTTGEGRTPGLNNASGESLHTPNRTCSKAPCRSLREEGLHLGHAFSHAQTPPVQSSSGRRSWLTRDSSPNSGSSSPCSPPSSIQNYGSPCFISPSSGSLNSVSPISVSPNSASPNSVSPNSASPISVSPNSGSPNSVSPNSVSPNSGSPNSASPNSASPISVSPNSGSPNSVSPNSGSPSSGGACCHSPDSRTRGRLLENSYNNSNTSADVSSGCFDLSYVTFRTLPSTACHDDASLQALYACFNPGVRAAASAGASRHNSLRSSATSLCHTGGYSPKRVG